MPMHDNWKRVRDEYSESLKPFNHVPKWMAVRSTGDELQAKLEAVQTLITNLDELQAKIRGTEGAEYRNLHSEICKAQTTMYQDVKEILES